MKHLIVIGLLLLALAGFAADGINVTLQSQRHWEFPASQVQFDCQFSMGRLATVKELATNRFLIFISPENQPINTSPWYAFTIASVTTQSVTLEFTNTYTTHRGIPRLSDDGETWRRADTNQYLRAANGNPPTLRLKVGSKPVWVAAWEMVDLPRMEKWTSQIASNAGATVEIAGYTLEHRPIHYFVLGNQRATNVVFVIGRQHPPEITGSLGLQSFIETLASNSTLTKCFRENFRVVVVPVVNPDGVEHGHWRSNLGGVDLNRDWLAFSQPETRALRDLISRIGSEPSVRPWVFIDFHSTGTNVFYAQPEVPGDFNSGFTSEWLAGLQHALPAFLFERDDSHNAELATGKSWVNGRFHIPAITCEFGYNTDRQLIKSAGQVEAEQLMQILMERFATPH